MNDVIANLRRDIVDLEAQGTLRRRLASALNATLYQLRGRSHSVRHIAYLRGLDPVTGWVVGHLEWLRGLWSEVLGAVRFDPTSALAARRSLLGRFTNIQQRYAATANFDRIAARSIEAVRKLGGAA